MQIDVKPGWKAGTKVKFANLGNEVRGGTAATIVFVVEEKAHDRFTREGDDLVYKLRIPLVDALAPMPDAPPTTISTLDKRSLTIIRPAGVIKPGQDRIISGEGMPISKSQGTRKGNLKVRYEIDFPARLNPGQQEGLRKVLS